MPDVSTQVIQTGAPVFTAEYVNNLAMAEDYKNTIIGIRNARIALARLMDAKVNEIQNIIDARGNLVDRFREQVLTTYPDLAGQDITALIATMSDNDPVKQLWNQFAPQVNDMRDQIMSKISELDQMSAKAIDQEAAETQGLIDYDDYAKTCTTQIPTVEDIENSLPLMTSLPGAGDQLKLVAQIPAIEELDPEAAAMVTEQALSMSTTGVDLSMAQQDAIVAAPPSTAAAAQAGGTIASLPQSYKMAGVALLLYLFFGGKKS